MKLSTHCYAVTGLGYIPPWEVNAGFIVGGHTTLVVDTGPSTLAAQTIYGYAQAAAPGNTISALNTEPHFDHLGGNGYFHSHGIPIYGHHLIDRSEDALEENVNRMNDSIIDPVRNAASEGRVFFSGTSIVNPDHRFSEAFDLDLGGVTVRVLMLPGHTYANAGVWIADDGVLFAGDALVAGYAPNYDAADGLPAWRCWLESFKLIRSLNPAFIVPGHGPVISGDDIGTCIASAGDELITRIDAAVHCR